jgi:hypothetical protein
MPPCCGCQNTRRGKVDESGSPIGSHSRVISDKKITNNTNNGRRIAKIVSTRADDYRKIKA